MSAPSESTDRALHPADRVQNSAEWTRLPGSVLGGGRLLWIPCPTGENLDPVGGELDPVGEVAAGGSGRERRRRSVGRRGRASLVAVINIARAYWRFIEAPGGAAMKR